jgi:hypothetical protein
MATTGECCPARMTRGDLVAQGAYDLHGNALLIVGSKCACYTHDEHLGFNFVDTRNGDEIWTFSRHVTASTEHLASLPKLA